METPAQQVYSRWLHDRGLSMEMAPVGIPPTGAFVRDLNLAASVLLVADLAHDNSETQIAMLRRLAAAIGPETSLAAATQEHMSAAVPGLLHVHPNLRLVVLLGDVATRSLHLSDAKAIQRQILLGPAAHELMADQNLKRDFWLQVKSVLLGLSH